MAANLQIFYLSIYLTVLCIINLRQLTIVKKYNSVLTSYLPL